MTATLEPTVGRLVTPAGVLVYDGPAHTEEWYAARRGGITATDMVKILGYGGDYGNATSVWAHKTGRLNDEPAGEAAQWGLDHEPMIALRWGERHSTSTSSVGVLARAEHPQHRASLDRLVTVCPDGDGPCGLQLKTRSAFKGGDWRDDVPDDVYFQEQWEAYVAGYRHMHVAALIGGNKLESHRVDLDGPDLAQMIAKADEVWAAVKANEPPRDAPNKLLTSVLNKLYPKREGQQQLTDMQVQGLLARHRRVKAALTEANAAQKKAKKAVEAVEAEMVALLGAHQAAFTDGSPEPAFAVVPRSRAGHYVNESNWNEIKVSKTWTPAAERTSA